MTKDLAIKLDGIIKGDNGREYTRLIGGFGEDNPIITVKQISELMDKEVKHINETINRNIGNFSEDEGYLIDLKEVDQIDHNLDLLKSLGYSNMQISKSKNIYILSQAGFLLFLKFAEGDKAIQIYKNFIEDYFKTKAENKVYENSIQKQIKEWKKEKATLYGMSIVEESDLEKVNILRRVEEINSIIIDLEKTLSKEEILEKLQGELHLVDTITNVANCYDVGNFSKILEVNGMGRNNLFKWLRGSEILMKGNLPYQKYAKYFKVIPFVINGEVKNKTLIRPEGIRFTIKKLIEDDIIIAKNVSEILSDLESITLE